MSASVFNPSISNKILFSALDFILLLIKVLNNESWSALLKKQVCVNVFDASVLKRPGPLGLKPEQSIVKQVFSLSSFANLINNLVTHREFTGIYLFVLLMQLASKTLLTVLNGTDAGKMFNKFVCDNIVLQIAFSG